jgi:transaldolase
MAFYIDSAFLHDIMNVAQTIPVAGVTTNPSILLAAQERGQMLSPLEVLKEQQLRIAFTAVTTVAQAYSAAQVSAEYIIPYYSRMERSGIDAAQRISEMAEVLLNAAAEANTTRILTASIKMAEEAASALLAGSDDLTVTPGVLLDLLTDPLTEEAIQRFTQDWQKLKKL